MIPRYWPAPRLPRPSTSLSPISLTQSLAKANREIYKKPSIEFFAKLLQFKLRHRPSDCRVIALPCLAWTLEALTSHRPSAIGHRRNCTVSNLNPCMHSVCWRWQQQVRVGRPPEAQRSCRSEWNGSRWAHLPSVKHNTSKPRGNETAKQSCKLSLALFNSVQYSTPALYFFLYMRQGFAQSRCGSW